MIARAISKSAILSAIVLWLVIRLERRAANGKYHG